MSRNCLVHIKAQKLVANNGGDMNINEVLDTAIQLEEIMSLFYHEICQLCHDQLMSEELIKLSAEEIAHKNLLITGKNYINATQSIIILKPKVIAKLKIGLKNISTLIQKIQNRKLNILSALQAALTIESSLYQYHLKIIDEVKDIALKRLFEILSTCDKAHEEKIQKFFSRTFTQEEISASGLS